MGTQQADAVNRRPALAHKSIAWEAVHHLLQVWTPSGRTLISSGFFLFGTCDPALFGRNPLICGISIPGIVLFTRGLVVHIIRYRYHRYSGKQCATKSQAMQ